MGWYNIFKGSFVVFEQKQIEQRQALWNLVLVLTDYTTSTLIKNLIETSQLKFLLPTAQIFVKEELLNFRLEKVVSKLYTMAKHNLYTPIENLSGDS